MKTKYKVKIGDYTIVSHVADAAFDPEETKKKIAPMITSKMTEADIKQLFNENLVYAKVGPEADLINDVEGDKIQKKLDEAGKHRRLLDNGKYIVDHRCCEYLIKESGRWVKEKIEEIGVELPEGAILLEDLTDEQRKEIADQQEGERLAGMSSKDREKAKEAELNALADEVYKLEFRHKVRHKPFDAQKYYDEGAEKIEAKWKKYK